MPHASPRRMYTVMHVSRSPVARRTFRSLIIFGSFWAFTRCAPHINTTVYSRDTALLVQNCRVLTPRKVASDASFSVSLAASCTVKRAMNCSRPGTSKYEADYFRWARNQLLGSYRFISSYHLLVKPSLHRDSKNLRYVTPMNSLQHTD